MWPINNPRIDQEFNAPNSYGPGKPHEGLDLNVKGTWGNQDKGTPIKCIYPGKVVYSWDATRDYGNMVVVECDTPKGKRWVKYCHLDKRHVTSGLVARGDVLGTMGSTGNSTASHLHLDVFKKKPNNWRDYYRNVLDWYVDPRELIEADIIDEMPDWLVVLLKDQLKLDLNASEGEIRGRVGEVKDKLNNYNDLQKRVTKLEKNLAFEAGESAKFEEELKISIESRARLEKENAELRTQVNKQEQRINELEVTLEELQNSIDPKKYITISIEEHARLTKRKQLDRHTTWELVRTIIGRWIPWRK